MKDAFKHLKWFFKLEWKKYLLCAFFLLTVSILPVFPAKFLGMAIDEIVFKTITVNKLILYSIGLVAFPVVTYLANIIYHYTINYLGHDLSYKLREQYIEHLFDLDSEIYEEYTKGDLIARATNDLQSITLLATSFLQSVVYFSALIGASITMMLIISPLLTVCAVSFMPIAIFFLNKKRLKKRQYYKIHHEIYANMTESVLETIEGSKTIRAYGQEDNDFMRTKRAIDADIDSWWKILKFESIYSPLFELVYVVAYMIAISLGSYLVIGGTISAGSLVTYLIYVTMLYNPLIGLSGILNNVNNINIAEKRYYEIMQKEPKVKDIDEPRTILKFKKIDFKDVSFKYEFDNFNVIEDITFTINSGETIGIVGPTGSGKSTLIRQLLRQFNVTSGEILIDGVDISNYKLEDIHNLVGYVPQEHILFRRSVDDNILIGNPSATASQIRKAVTISDFRKDLEHLPYGSSTMVAELGGSLSGGQQQRLSIARALVKDPEILILDDSLSAVDAITERNIIEQLRDKRSKKTNIIVTHRFSAIAKADKIIVLENGKITRIGNHEELLKDDNWYKLQYLKQIKGDSYVD